MDNSTASAIGALQANMDTAQKDINEIKNDVKGIVTSLSDLTTKFVSREEFNLYKSKSWYTHLLSALAGAALAALGIFTADIIVSLLAHK